MQIEAFNQEEEAFGWQTTAYPQRLSIINTLKPYHNLYELTVDFNTKYKYVQLSHWLMQTGAMLWTNVMYTVALPVQVANKRKKICRVFPPHSEDNTTENDWCDCYKAVG